MDLIEFRMNTLAYSLPPWLEYNQWAESGSLGTLFLRGYRPIGWGSEEGERMLIGLKP